MYCFSCALVVVVIVSRLWRGEDLRVKQQVDY